MLTIKLVAITCLSTLFRRLSTTVSGISWLHLSRSVTVTVAPTAGLHEECLQHFGYTNTVCATATLNCLEAIKVLTTSDVRLILVQNIENTQLYSMCKRLRYFLTVIFNCYCWPLPQLTCTAAFLDVHQSTLFSLL